MHPYCIYVFDSSTANEAAIAVKEGQYESILQYHSNKHQHMSGKQMHHQAPTIQGPPPPPPQSHHMMGGPPSYSGPTPPPLHHHMSPPNHMQQHPMPAVPPPPPSSAQQQTFDPNLSPQKIREIKLSELSKLAHMTQPPPPPTMHPMTRAGQPPHQTPHQVQPQQAPPTTQQYSLQLPPQQQQPAQIKQEAQQQQQQQLDPLSSLAAMSECPSMDRHGHTIHHHPPPS